jgi:phage gpG-like protein
MPSTLVDLSNWLQQLPGELEPQASELQQAAENQRARILDRTSRGLGYDLQIFTGYNRHTGKTGVVNLRDTGAMLDSITVEANDDQARIFFDDPEQAKKAEFHNEGNRKIPQRPFFGASLSDREEIVSDVRQALFSRVNK